MSKKIRTCGLHCEYYDGVGILDKVEIIRCMFGGEGRYLPLQAAQPCRFGLEKKTDEPSKEDIIRTLNADL